MKCALALCAVAFAAQDDELLNDYVDMMMRQASGESDVDGTDLDEAIQAKHGHGPHGHNPHHHWPHRHNPHRHNPHRHTPFPTPFPTPHPCDDGSHGCEKGVGGICYKTGGSNWSCGCKNTHWCSRGCSQPHKYHTCTVITPAPTAYPTPYPTTYPTPYPTSAPTAAPTTIGVEEIEAIRTCCEKEIAIDIKFIMPLHTCEQVRAANDWDIREALHRLEMDRGLLNTDVLDWLTTNRCFHDDFGTHFPTPAPTTNPTIEPALTHEKNKFGHFDKYDEEAGKINPDQKYSHRNFVTLYPTPAPTGGFKGHKNARNDGNLADYEDQSDRTAQPTHYPTAFPTKDTDTKFGSRCTDKATGFSKPAGWVGAGPHQFYCNVWKCEPNKSTFGKSYGFKGQQKRCSVEKYGKKFCSHVKCVVPKIKGRTVIRTHHSHKEKTGGRHICSLARHTKAKSAGRPKCDCVCHGARRQDAAGFERTLNEISQMFTSAGKRIVADNHDATSDANSFDANKNKNNLYTQHSNGVANENDQAYKGERVAHFHVDN